MDGSGWKNRGNPTAFWRGEKSKLDGDGWKKPGGVRFYFVAPSWSGGEAKASEEGTDAGGVCHAPVHAGLFALPRDEDSRRRFHMRRRLQLGVEPFRSGLFPGEAFPEFRDDFFDPPEPGTRQGDAVFFRRPPGTPPQFEIAPRQERRMLVFPRSCSPTAPPG